MHSATHDAIAAIWRIDAAQVVAGVARMVRDVSLAEDLAQEALVAALERWPRDGLPDRPGAWLLTTARNWAVDRARREAQRRGKQEAAWRDGLTGPTEPDTGDDTSDTDMTALGDDRLRLIF